MEFTGYRDSVICKTVNKKAEEDIRKHSLVEIGEAIEASKGLKNVRTQSRQNPDDNTPGLAIPDKTY